MAQTLKICSFFSRVGCIKSHSHVSELCSAVHKALGLLSALDPFTSSERGGEAGLKAPFYRDWSMRATAGQREHGRGQAGSQAFLSRAHGFPSHDCAFDGAFARAHLSPLTHPVRPFRHSRGCWVPSWTATVCQPVGNKMRL